MFFASTLLLARVDFFHIETAPIFTLVYFCSRTMATTQVIQTMQTLEPVPDTVVFEEQSIVANDAFDPNIHLDFKLPSRVYTMRDLNLPEDVGVSPIAVSEPFPLFTKEAIRRMRDEIFNPEVMDNYQVSSNLAHCQLRGFAAK